MSAITATPEVTTVTHEHGATRRLATIVARKAAPGAIGLLALQHTMTVPAFLAFSAPIAGFFGLHVAA